MSFPNSDQLAVIETVKESLLVLAPMGTGKTRTAAAAIRKAIESGIEPERILGLTFTNRAAEAMRAAVAEALPEKSHRVHLFNLHGLCARLLREEGALCDLPPDFGILDEDESADLLWQFIPKSEREKLYKGKMAEARDAYDKHVFDFLLNQTSSPTPAPFMQYRNTLRREGIVDFTGLIARTWHLLKRDPGVRERWQGRYQWMLVDEVQDINFAEYQIISILGGLHRCVKFFGDVHQTIFEWRHARPNHVLEAFEEEFSPRKLALKMNYRCSQVLVEATNAVRKSFIPSDEPLPQAFQDSEHDQAVQLSAFDTAEKEMEELVSQVMKWKKEGIPYGQMAILTRQRQTLIETSSMLKSKEIPHLVADDFDFFRRKEVKDVTSVLEHLVSPFRRHPILRLLKLFGASGNALDALEKSTQGTGLHIGYLVRGASGDPLRPLVEAFQNQSLIALDTETTGLDPTAAEIIQFARVGQSPDRSFMEYIRPVGKVGESVHTHGFTDKFLAENGKDAAEVLKKGLDFEKGQILLGHNLEFDLRMIRAVCGRLGLEADIPMYFDTMPLAANMLPREKLSGLRLETVTQALEIKLSNAHQAQADAAACISILEKLMPQLVENHSTRLKIIADLGSELGLAFRKTTGLFQKTRQAEGEVERISELIPKIWKLLVEIPGEHDYKINPARTKNIEDLAAVARFLEERRGGKLSPSMFLEQVALSRWDMTLEADPDRVRLLTAHAAKGLEFEAVALPRLVAPWKDYTPEEARVFYVMLTRAKKHLWLSWPKKFKTSWGEEKSTRPLKYLTVLEPYAKVSL